MKRSLYVGSAQMGVCGDIAVNTANILDMLSDCAGRGVEIVLFPETCVSGYSPELRRQRLAREWAVIEEALEQIKLHCAQRGIWAIVGSDAYSGRDWHNREYAISSGGQVVAHYDKVHLTSGDVDYYVPGRQPSVFEINGVKVGLQICYDLRFPEGYRYLLDQGVQVIMQGFYGAGGDTWKVPVMHSHLVSRAAESGCFVVAANVGNSLQIMHSAIIDPLGMVLARANQDTQEIITAVIDIERIQQSTIRHDFMTRFGRLDF